MGTRIFLFIMAEMLMESLGLLGTFVQRALDYHSQPECYRVAWAFFAIARGSDKLCNRFER